MAENANEGAASSRVEPINSVIVIWNDSWRVLHYSRSTCWLGFETGQVKLSQVS